MLKKYVDFITKIGDGETIRSEIYETQKLVLLDRYELLGYPLEHIDIPFPLEYSWMPDWGDTIDGFEDTEDNDVINQRMAEQ